MAKKTEKNNEKQSAKNGEMPKPTSYEAKDIYVLEGLEPVRKRPGMYIGSTGPDGLHHLIWEVVDNSIDEAMAGFAKNITVELLLDKSVAVTDDGRGIPVETHHQTKKSALETVMTTLHAGGKFGGESYKVAGGLHGVGVSVVNALSTWLRVEVSRGNLRYAQEYKQGAPSGKVKKIGTSKHTGTKVTFLPDPTIFSEIDFNDKRILDHLRQQAYLTKGVRINFFDRRGPQTSCYGFYFEGGLLSFVKFLAEDKKTIQDEVFHVQKVHSELDVEVAFLFTEGSKIDELSFANNIYTPDGGMHLTGFRSALTRTLNNYARSEGYLKEKDENFTSDDVREGLISITSVKLREPQFEGQTKARLGNPEARTATEAVVNEGLKEFLEKHPQEARKIIEKVLITAKARIAAKAAKETVLRKGALDGFTLPGKLADCTSKNAAESELFIVEGDSAGGCFSGDTRIALTDGRDLSLKELTEEAETGKQNYCYTIDKNGAIQIAPILHPRVTKKNAEVVKIILDNDEEITCTPDHQFMLRDGSYKEARKLTKHDSIMPLRRQISRLGKHITIKGYELVWSPAENRWTQEFREKRKTAYNKTYLRKTLAVLHDIWLQTGLIDEAKYDEIRKDLKDRSLICLQTISSRFFDNDKSKLQEAVANYNHRIKAVMSLSERIDVYDIEVPETHNFALASGVFVHNSAKQGRDRRIQAIFPLRGKPLNVERARIDKMLANAEIRSLVVAIGTAIAEEFDLSSLRYHKIIIMSDADVDGAHIRTLLLTLFYRYFKPVIESGYLYIAQPPLYRIQSGKSVKYAWSDAGKESTLKEILSEKAKRAKGDKEEPKEEANPEASETGEKISGVSIQRYKGLGEMNPEQLWETTMNPENRTLRQVSINDAAEADRMFDVLMGDEVEPRKKFIQTHATTVQNLDV